MISMDLDATYDGMNIAEVYKEFVKPMQEMGMSDDVINEMLEEHKDKKEQEHEC